MRRTVPGHQKSGNPYSFTAPRRPDQAGGKSGPIAWKMGSSTRALWLVAGVLSVAHHGEFEGTGGRGHAPIARPRTWRQIDPSRGTSGESVIAQSGGLSSLGRNRRQESHPVQTSHCPVIGSCKWHRGHCRLDVPARVRTAGTGFCGAGPLSSDRNNAAMSAPGEDWNIALTPAVKAGPPPLAGCRR